MKNLKSVRPPAADIVRIARAQDPTVPPAALEVPAEMQPGTREVVQLNFRVGRDLADQLADRARAENTAQRVLICRALAAAGYGVEEADLADKPPPTRRGRTIY